MTAGSRTPGVVAAADGCGAQLAGLYFDPLSEEQVVDRIIDRPG